MAKYSLFSNFVNSVILAQLVLATPNLPTYFLTRRHMVTVFPSGVRVSGVTPDPLRPVWVSALVMVTQVCESVLVGVGLRPSLTGLSTGCPVSFSKIVLTTCGAFLAPKVFNLRADISRVCLY